MEAHVERFWHLQRDASISQTDGDFIVAKDGRRRLRVAHVVEDLSLVRRDARGGKGAAHSQNDNNDNDDDDNNHKPFCCRESFF